MEFKDWLMQKFLEWEKEKGGRQSYSAFARYLGIKTSTMTQWRIGNNPPSLEMADTIAQKLGNEVYSILGYATPDSVQVGSLPPRFASALLAADKAVKESGLVNENDKFLLTQSIMRQHGFEITTNRSDDNESLT
jgi:transcriptional regulator with XRE-family HTH domain